MMTKKAIQSILVLLLTVSLAKADYYDGGVNDGTYVAEGAWSGDCADIWTFDDVCEQIINDKYTVVPGDNWKEKLYKYGGEDGVNDVLEKYQIDCAEIDPDVECNPLGEAAARIIADKFCGSILGRGTPDYEANCRAVAINRCLGKVEEKVEASCPEKDLPISELLDLQNQCDETIDWLLSRRLLRH